MKFNLEKDEDEYILTVKVLRDPCTNNIRYEIIDDFKFNTIIITEDPKEFLDKIEKTLEISSFYKTVICEECGAELKL